jgi:putative addiction module killer protein
MLIELRKTPEFVRWVSRLRDDRAEIRINSRLDLLTVGHPGDHKPVGEGVYELRIHYGPGYRVYYTHHGSVLVIILAGGDKSSQDKDIRLAKKLAKEY